MLPIFPKLSLSRLERHSSLPFGPFSLVGLCPNFPIFLKLPKLSPSRMGHYGQSRTPGQGQDNGHYPTESKVTAILRVVGGSSRVAAILGVIGENTFWAL